MLTLRLDEANRLALRTHLLALDAEDRRLRFGFAARDASIERYVADIDFTRDAVFGVPGEGRALDGIAHLALDNHHAEIGVSVLKHARGRGIGSVLVSRAAVHARNRGIKLLFMQCLSENRAIMRIARALGMRVVTDGRESEASLSLPAADAVSVKRESEADPIALCDAALKQSLYEPAAITAPRNHCSTEFRAAPRTFMIR
jgi:RimJ/RimL family protein N-acetyltransferase